jgi:carboxypeptidase family protein/TonB-dependent receptor-like protein
MRHRKLLDKGETDGHVFRVSLLEVRSMSHISLALRRARNVVGRLGILLGLLGLAPSWVLGQTTTGSIRGYVRDPSGAPVGDAQVTARSVDMGASRNTTANVSGFYNLGGLRPGAYQLTYRRIGFGAQTRNARVLIGQAIELDVQLAQTAATLQAVVVSGTVGVETRTSEVGTNVTREQIQDLPLFDRNFLDLAKLAPGVTASAVNNSDKFVSAGGQPPEAINVFVDGATYKNDVLRGGVVGQDASKGNPFPQGAVQEFRLVTQNYKAEYQKATSAIITATTRSGGNNWEVDGFFNRVGKEYVAKDALASLKGAPRSNYTRLQAGGSVGGPLRKDKLFAFGTYELNFRDEPALVTLGGNATLAPAGLNPQQFAGTFTSEFREHLGFGKLTWVKSDRSTIDGSVTVRHETDFRSFGGQTSFETAENVYIDVLTGVANWKHAGDRWLNEAQINAQHFVWNPRPLNPNLIGKDYQGIIRIGGRDSRQQFTQNRLSLRNDVTRSALQLGGDHVFKAGASVDFLSYEAIKDFNGNPVFRFRAAENYTRPFEAAFGFGDPQIGTSNAQIGLYAQDDWTATQKLVLNLGIRWDVETNMINNGYVTPQPLRDSLAGPLNAQLFADRPTLRPDGTCCNTVNVRVVDQLGGLNRFVTRGREDRPMYLGAFQPRLGASYDVLGTGRTVIFGGVGIYYDRNYWNTLLDEQFRRQFKVLTATFNTTGPTAQCPRCVAWDPKYFDPAQLRTLAGSSALPEVFLVANDLKPPKSYQTSVGVRQGFRDALVTVSYNGIRGYNGMNFVRGSPFGGLGPNYATLFVTDDRVRSWYDALQFQVDRPLRSGTRWGGSVAYTLARAQEQGQTTDLFWGFDSHYPTVGDLPRRRAPGNQTHTIVGNGMLRLPYDLRFSSIVSLGSGLTQNAIDATGGRGFGLEKSYVYTPAGKPFLGMGHVFNTQNADFRLEKDLTLTSGQRVGLAVDLFNAFNSANFGCYDAFINPTTEPANANFGKPNCAGLGRRLQVGLRYGMRSASSATDATR